MVVVGGSDDVKRSPLTAIVDVNAFEQYLI